jgi:hypothetical protein
MRNLYESHREYSCHCRIELILETLEIFGHPGREVGHFNVFNALKHVIQLAIMRVVRTRFKLLDCDDRNALLLKGHDEDIPRK